MSNKIRNALPYLFLVLLTFLVLDLANPLFDRPARDGGFFLYTGNQILDGKIPYQDFWDSKGPAIFYINAFGLFMGGGSRWGVWIVEFVCIFGTFWFLLSALSKRLGLGAALFGLTMAALGLRLTIGYGNYTEEYALLFNAAGLFIFLSMEEGEQNDWKYFWIGALFGVSFSFRANNIGGLFAILGAVIFFQGFKKNLTEMLKIISAALAGFALPLLLWTIYFALTGNAGEMIYASLIFNFSYSAAKDRSWLDLFGGFGRYGMGTYGWFTLLAWFVFGFRFLVNFVQRKVYAFEVFLLLWFPIEILLSNLSGRNFTHYYISWILAIAVYCAFVFTEFWQLIFRIPWLEGRSDSINAVIAAVLIVGVFMISPSSWARYGETFRMGGGEFVDPISTYIRDNTNPEDLVLTWYPEMGVSFMAGRASPVKYLYYPLFLEGSLTEEIESTYVEDLITNRPVLILDCSRQVDAIPSLDPATRKEQYATPGVKRKMYIHPGMDAIFDFVSANYHVETTMDGCLVFRLNAR